MKQIVHFRITGARHEVESVLRALEAEPGFSLVRRGASTAPRRPMQRTPPFGNVDLVDVLVSFATSLAAGGTLEGVKEIVNRLSGGRRIEVSSVEPDVSPGSEDGGSVTDPPPEEGDE